MDLGSPVAGETRLQNGSPVSPPHTPLYSSPRGLRSSVPRNLSFQSYTRRKAFSITPLTPTSKSSSPNHLVPLSPHTPHTPSQLASPSNHTPRTPRHIDPSKNPLSPSHLHPVSPKGEGSGEIIPVTIIGFIHLGCERQYLLGEDEVVVSTYDPPPPEPEVEPEPEPKKKVRISVAKTKVLQPEPPPPEVKEPELVDLKIVCDCCHEPINGEYIRGNNDERVYHRKCFVCSLCRKPLEEYFKTGDEGAEKLFCGDCYRLSHPEEKCARCGKPITDESLRVNGMCLHKDCFVCATCGKVLGTRYVTRDGRYFCPPTSEPGLQCWSAGLEALCVVCGKPLAGKHAVITDEGKKYHDECFTCGLCHKVLSSADYYIADLKEGPTLCCESCCSVLV